MNHNIEERLKQHYAEAGISRKVYEFGMKIETDLKERLKPSTRLRSIIS